MTTIMTQVVRATLGHGDFGVETFRNGAQINDWFAIGILWFVEGYPEGRRCPLSKNRVKCNFAMHQIDELFEIS